MKKEQMEENGKIQVGERDERGEILGRGKGM